MGDGTNNQNNPIEDIRLAFGLIEGEYRIERENFFYVVKPASENQKLEINVRIANVDIFNQYHLIFKSCIFKDEIFFNNQTFLHRIEFEDCIFEAYAHFIDTTFNEIVRFCGSTFRNGAIFLEATFEKTANFSGATLRCMSFPYATFKKGANFGATFKKWVDFSHATFEKKVDFSGAEFEEEAKQSGMILEKIEANFSNATFKEEVNFSNVNFKVDIYFNDAKFQKVDFSDATFLQNADFQNSHFNEQAFFSHATFQQVSFRGSIFDSNAYFFEAKFGTIPDFLQVNFNKNINFTNTELDFGFDEAKEKIEEIYKNREDECKAEQNKKDKKYKEVPKRHKISNEFRDSFRNIKSALIKDNNMLDASNYHRVELYLKELELEYRNLGLRDFVDRIQLYCYRVTSDHHTDLLLILNNVLGLIVLFGAFVCGLCCFASYDTKCIDYECCTSAEVYYLHSLMTNSFCVDCNVWSIFCLEAFLIMFVCCAFVVAFILLVFFFSYVNSICRELGYWFIAFFVFVLFILAVKPAIMLPIFGKLIDESLKIDFPAFTSLSVVYAILMFLLIWSLQKTARKNTIIPN